MGLVPSYEFNIYLLEKPEVIGRISLRIGNTNRVKKYSGHIGYGIKEEYRGNHYAAKACNLVKQVAIDHGLKILWITVNPDNYPSRRTCEILGCEMVEIIDIPEYLDMYRQGERQKCRYCWNLNNI
jgi:tagatose 1,6-diphosphate aldolase